MRHLRILPSLLLLVLAAPAFAQGPALTVERDDWDFGEVPRGEPVTHEFSLRNTGDEPLILFDIAKPCGCQSAEFTEEPIPPGGEGFVRATYNAKKQGSFVKTFTIKHNGETGRSAVTLRGTVGDRRPDEG